MTLSRAALTLSLCLLPALAFAQDSLPGQYELTGKYSNRRHTRVELTITKTNSSSYSVRRKGIFTSRRHRDTPPVEWYTRSVRVSESGRVAWVTYTRDAPSNLRGLVNGLDPDTPRDDALDLLTESNVFKALYFLSADGQSIREVVANTTRLGDNSWWRSISTEGARVQAPTVAPLSPGAYLAIRDDVIKSWYLDDTREYYDHALADPTLTADERRDLEEDRDLDMDFSNTDIMDGAWWFEDEIIDRYDNSDPTDNDPFLDTHGRPIPKAALEPVTLSMFPEHAGIGLSKSFLFDTRTGELIAEGDIMD